MEQRRRLIFLDIDGTLIDGESVPRPSALEAIRQAQSRGHLAALCSGRNYGMLSPFLRYGFDGVIASAGGYILWDGQVLRDCPMTPEQQARILKAFSGSGVFHTLEARDRCFADEGFMEQFRRSIAPEVTENSELLRWRRQMEESLGVYPLSRYQGEPLYKVVFTCGSEAQLEEPRRLLEEEFSFCIQGVRPGCVNGELINRKFHKGDAVERVCRHLGIPPEDTVAFGDSMNDLEMLETAGVGVCMGNGDSRLKEHADLVCPPVGEDGLYEGFRACGLIE